MKPIKLIMTGFESYCNRTEIDFTKLNRNGLFLISGPTGSGKTTIFDAISYALFGEPSGDVRKESMLRSTLADENIPTEVELLFEVNGKEYKVKRNPQYTRKAKKGNSTTTEKPNAELIFPDGREAITQTSKVSAAIEDLLKMKKKDFCQISMIAQGAFQKFLLASTDEKKSIFREIFKTSKYRDLEDRLSTNASILTGKARDCSKGICQYVREIECCDETLNEQLQILKEKSYIEKSDIEFLEKVAESNSLILENIKKEIKKNQDEAEKINSQAAIANEKTRTLKQNAQLNALLLTEKERCKKFEAEYEKAVSREDEKTQLNEEIIKLKDSLSDYDELDEQNKKLIAAINEQKILSSKINTLSSELSELTYEIDNKKKTVLSFTKSSEKIITLTNEIRETENQKIELSELAEKLVSLKTKKNSAQSKKEEVKKLMTEHDEAENKFRTNYEIFIRNQAGILAQELEENKPCPVCGSTEHPHPAEKSSGALSKEELDKLENTAKNLREKLNSQVQKLSALNAEIETEEKLINKNLSSFIDESQFNEAEQLISEKIKLTSQLLKEKKDNLEVERKNVIVKETIEKEIPELEKKKTDDEKELNECNSTLEGKKVFINEKTESVNSLKEKLLFDSKEKAVYHQKELENIIRTIDKTIADTRSAKEECEKSVLQLAGQIQQTEETLKAYKDIDEAKIFSEQEKILKAQKDLANKHEYILPAAKNARKNLQSILSIFDELDAIENERKMVCDLSDIANGNNNAAGKVRLETFVQSAFFDRIIERANIRFRTMSAHQYELIRDNSALNHRNQIGLDLNVIDHHNGSHRAVSSLSGGEQFQASLSLALGLADEIQESAGGGGIHLDSMFIDEGFGTLDSDTLKKAMSALMELSKTDKTIGIISHVEELKNKIESRIIVNKDVNGCSTLSIEA